MKIPSLLIPALLAATVFGCSSPVEPATPAEAIIGHWKWVSTFNPWGGRKVARADQMDVTSFARDDTYMRILNGRIVGSGRYTVTGINEKYGRITLDDELYGQAFRVEHGALIYTEPNVYDYQVTVYHRTR